MTRSASIFPSTETEAPTFGEAMADIAIRFVYTPGPCEMRALIVGGRTVTISDELLESIEETASIVGDPQAMAAFRSGVSEIAAGRGIPWSEAKARLGL